MILEFTVTGPPVSAQSKNKALKRAWINRVKNAARVTWTAEAVPYSGLVKVTIVYFYEAKKLDGDNLAKPILDALQGLIYNNDAQVTDVAVRRTNIEGRFRIRKMSQALANAFSRGDEFIHVRIDEQPDHGEFL